MVTDQVFCAFPLALSQGLMPVMISLTRLRPNVTMFYRLEHVAVGGVIVHKQMLVRIGNNGLVYGFDARVNTGQAMGPNLEPG